MSIAEIQFKTNPETGRLETSSVGILEVKVKELFDKHLYYVMRYMELTAGPITFKATPEKFIPSSVNSVFKAFGVLVEAKNMVRICQESDLEEEKADREDFMMAFLEKHTLKKTTELQEAKVALEEVKKSTGIEVEFNDT